MTSFGLVAKRAQKFTIDNSPMIVTAMAVAGTLATAYFTGKATFKAAELISDAQFKENIHGDRVLGKPHMLTTKEKVNLVWKCYIPPAFVLATTIACTIGANQIGARRTANLAAAYSLSQKAYNEYKEKVIERIGDAKEQKIVDEIAQDRIDRDPVSNREVIIAGGGEVLCYDSYSGRYFESSVEAIKKAQNDTNYQLLNDGYASLTEFYRRIGLPQTSQSEEVGWNSEEQVEIRFSTVISEDQRPCISIDFMVAPVRDYFRFR